MTPNLPKPSQRPPAPYFAFKSKLIALSLSLFAGIISLPTEVKSADDGLENFPVRGIIRASSEATLATNVVALVKHIGFKEGQHFKKGDVLVAFDCTTQNAELSAAKAVLREKKVVLKSARYLHKRNAGNLQDVETAQAIVDHAAAEVKAKEGYVAGCNIIAPYDGSIAELTIQEHEMSAIGSPLLRIVHTSKPEIELIVPSVWLRNLKPGKIFEFHVDETGQDHIGKVTRTGSVVDAVSQTVKVFASISSGKVSVLPGMSGTAKF
ncbi:MAG: efflux RND transporter periplasmic adaptor subunit [Pseudomonadota bacterium]